MNKYLISLISLLVYVQAYAADQKWVDLEIGSSYSLSTEINLVNDQSSFSLKPNIKMLLKNQMSLDMIKVQLLKFDISHSGCPSREMTTDIQLLEVVQNSGKVVTVGYDLAEGCILEIYVEFIDLNSQSFFHL